MSDHIRLPLAALAAVTAPPGSRASVADLPGADGLMQVGDLARECGKTVRAIHLYEELGLLRPAARSKGRFRLYGNEAVLRIRWIQKLQDLGFSLTDIQGVAREFDEAAGLASAGGGGSASAAMLRLRDLYRQKLEETRVQLARLQTLEGEIVASLEYLEACGVCDPHRLVSACKQCDQHAHDAPELVAGFRANPS